MGRLTTKPRQVPLQTNGWQLLPGQKGRSVRRRDSRHPGGPQSSAGQPQNHPHLRRQPIGTHHPCNKQPPKIRNTAARPWKLSGNCHQQAGRSSACGPRPTAGSQETKRRTPLQNWEPNGQQFAHTQESLGHGFGRRLRANRWKIGKPDTQANPTSPSHHPPPSPRPYEPSAQL